MVVIEIALTGLALISAFVAKRSRAPYVVAIIAVAYNGLCLLGALWLFRPGGVFIAVAAAIALCVALSIVALVRASKIGR